MTTKCDIPRDLAHTLARAVAPLLGDEWRHVPPRDGDTTYPTAFIAGPEGRELAFHVKSWGADAGKVSIHGNYPTRDADGDYVSAEKLTEISVNSTRGSVAIAQEIKRRLLPAYEAAFSAAVARIAERNAYLSGRDALGARLAAAAGPAVGSHTGLRGKISIWAEPMWGDVTCSDDSVAIDVHGLSPDLAERIIRMIAENAKGEG